MIGKHADCPAPHAPASRKHALVCCAVQLRLTSSQDKAWQAHSIPPGLGMECARGTYKWRQNQSHVEVFVRLPPGVTADAVHVDITTNAMHVLLPGEGDAAVEGPAARIPAAVEADKTAIAASSVPGSGGAGQEAHCIVVASSSSNSSSSACCGGHGSHAAGPARASGPLCGELYRPVKAELSTWFVGKDGFTTAPHPLPQATRPDKLTR